MVTTSFGKRLFTLSETKFENILFLDDADLRGVPSLRVRFDETTRAISIASRQEETAWTTNSSMLLELRDSSGSEALGITESDARLSRGHENHVEREQFYLETGNDYRGEFRSMKEAWNLGSVGVVSLVEYERHESAHIPLRTCAWLDVCSHASLCVDGPPEARVLRGSCASLSCRKVRCFLKSENVESLQGCIWNAHRDSAHV